MPTRRPCRCHSSSVYASLTECPKCGHNSYDRIAESCERRTCGYEAEPSIGQGGSFSSGMTWESQQEGFGG